MEWLQYNEVDWLQRGGLVEVVWLQYNAVVWLQWWAGGAKGSGREGGGLVALVSN